MSSTSSTALVAALLAALVPSALGHAWLVEPPARNAHPPGPRNGYAPQSGNGGGVCGDGGQWPQSSNYLGGQNDGPLRTYTAGQVVEFEVKVTAHHKGHMELHICEEHLGPLTQDPEGPNGCLSKWTLQRVRPEEVYSDCIVDDPRDDCQPLDEDYPERWYLSPGGGTHKMHFRIPDQLQCQTCTLQWRWWTANSCTPAPGYGCYFQKLGAAGWAASRWCGSFCGTCGLRGSHREGCGEEFRNCADITVLPSGAPAPPPGPTTTPSPAPTPTPTPTPSPSTCVSQSVLTCINDYSSYWPKCDPGQAKNNIGPLGYEFGHYCTQEWTDALNAVLSDPMVDKCGDSEAIHKFLAQVAYETGYYSTVYQPLDGGAGLIHMIPANWVPNAEDMDALWPGGDFAEKAASMGKNFFQSAAYGWRSVAAWFKETNRVIPGCGQDLFGQAFDDQTKCILGRAVSRQEAYDIVGKCMAQNPVATTQVPAITTTAATTTTAPATTTAATTTQATTTQTPTTPMSTPEPEPEPETTPQPTGCVHNTDCSASAWCNDGTYVKWCPANYQNGYCPSPMCTLAPSATQATTTQAPATTTTAATTTAALATTTAATTTQATTTPISTTPEPEPEPETTPSPTGCVHNTDCGASAWCNDGTYAKWCPANYQNGYCPSPMCTLAPSTTMQAPTTPMFTAR